MADSFVLYGSQSLTAAWSKYHTAESPSTPPVRVVVRFFISSEVSLGSLACLKDDLVWE